MPHVKNTKTEERFEMFKWLLQFFVDVEAIGNTPYVDPNDVRDMKTRLVKVRRAVFQGLQYLLNMGRVVPPSKMEQDNYLITLLRGMKGMDKEFATHYSISTGHSVHGHGHHHGGNRTNKSILQVFIEAEDNKFEVLTPLLTFQFESLISFYIEQASTHPTGKHHFFRAIVNVIQQDGGVERLTAVESGYGKNDWKIIRHRGQGFVDSVFHYANKLLFLGFIMIIEPQPVCICLVFSKKLKHFES